MIFMFNEIQKALLHQDFTFRDSSEFRQDIEVISKNKLLMVREGDGKIVKANFFKYLLENLKGVFGRVNHADPHLVEDRFIRMLQDGDSKEIIDADLVQGPQGETWEKSTLGKIVSDHGWAYSAVELKKLQKYPVQVRILHSNLEKVITDIYNHTVNSSKEKEILKSEEGENYQVNISAEELEAEKDDRKQTSD
jgi:hypothetical protein